MKPRGGALALALEALVDFYNMKAGPNLAFLAESGVSRLPTFLFGKDGEAKGSLAGTNDPVEEIAAETGKLQE